MAGRFDLNYEVIFYGTIKSAQLLDFPLTSLSDKDLNSTESANIELTEGGLNLSVTNADTHTQAVLIVESAGFENFYCGRSVSGQLKVAEVVEVVREALLFADSITISHAAGDNELTFILGGDPTLAKKVKITPGAIVDERIPFVEKVCEVPFPFIFSKDLKTPGAKISVVVNLPSTLKTATEVLVKEGTESKGFEFLNHRFQRSGSVTGENLTAEFKLWHLSAIKKVLVSRSPCHFSILALPPPEQRVMIRFGLQGLGCLAFIYTARIS